MARLTLDQAVLHCQKPLSFGAQVHLLCVEKLSPCWGQLAAVGFVLSADILLRMPWEGTQLHQTPQRLLHHRHLAAQLLQSRLLRQHVLWREAHSVAMSSASQDLDVGVGEPLWRCHLPANMLKC